MRIRPTHVGVCPQPCAQIPDIKLPTLGRTKEPRIANNQQSWHEPTATHVLCAECVWSKGLGQQLVHELGSWFEAKLVPKALEGGEVCAGALVVLGRIDLDNAHQLERGLVRYREGYVRGAAAESLMYLLGTTDKSRVYGMHLAQNAS